VLVINGGRSWVGGQCFVLGRNFLVFSPFFLHLKNMILTHTMDFCGKKSPEFIIFLTQKRKRKRNGRFLQWVFGR